MTVSLTALLLFTAWTLLLVFVATNWRAFEMVAKRVPANSWGRDNKRSVPEWVKRMEHAHLNCLENLPIFAAIVLVAVTAGKSAVIDGLAMCVVYARVGQSVTHLIGTSALLVVIRAAFFFVQILLFGYMLFLLLA